MVYSFVKFQFVSLARERPRLPCVWRGLVQCKPARQIQGLSNCLHRYFPVSLYHKHAFFQSLGRVVCKADPDQKEEIGAQYPDAAFATMIAGSIFNHNRLLGEITQRAYFSILEGESIGIVRFAYERATDEYWKEHMWDD